MAAQTPLPHLPKDHYIPEIDGLRAVAVVSVVLFHLHALILPGGFAGVDVFFVISGFVVTASLLRHEGERFTRFTAAFYVRRILRIFPALIVCLLVTALLKALFIPTSWLSNAVSKTAIAACFGLGNVALHVFSDGYFSPRTEFNPFTHTWSLGVEEQFYFLFPPVVYLWLRWRKASHGWWAVALLLGGFAASLSFAAYETSANQPAAYFLLPSRFWELAIGALLCQAYAQGDHPLFGPRYRSAKLYGGVLLLAAGFWFSREDHFPFPWALLPTMGTALVILGILSRDERPSLVKQALAAAPMIWIGQRSYSIYLWHWPVFVTMRWTTGLESPGLMLIGLVLSMVLGDLSYRWVETPVRTQRWHLRVPALQVIGVGMASILVAAGLIFAIFKYDQNLTLSRTGDVRQWYPLEWKEGVPSSGRFAGRTLFILGDSHAVAYGTLAGMLQEREGARVVTMGLGEHPVANLLHPVGDRLTTDRWYLSAFERIRNEARPGDVVLLASLRAYRYGNQWGPYAPEAIEAARHSPEALQAREAALREAAEIIQRLQAMGLTVVLDAPKPVLPSPPFRVADWFNRMNPVGEPGLSIPRAQLEEDRAPVLESIAALQRLYPRLIVWDPFNTLCPGEDCHAFDADDEPLFFDGDHLSAHGNRVLYPEFVAILERVWGE